MKEKKTNDSRKNILKNYKFKIDSEYIRCIFLYNFNEIPNWRKTKSILINEKKINHNGKNNMQIIRAVNSNKYAYEFNVNYFTQLEIKVLKS